MTINIANNDPRINYTATAGQTVFTVPFEFFDNTDIKVYIEGTLKTITTHYTVSGGNGSTGTVTLVTGATLNDEVTLVRDVPMERTTDLTSSYNGSSIDAQLDRIVAQIADLDDKASRTIQINDYELASGLLLPALDNRKGKTIQFNTSTGALEVGPTGADLTAIGSVTSEIATLAGISGNITTVAGSNAQVVAVGNAMTSVTAINAALSNVNTVAGGISNINLVGGSISDVNDVADSLGEISAVQAKLTNIDTVAIASTNIGTVAGSIAQVNSVASKIADVTGVNSNIAAITTANANSTNVDLVANNIDDVNDVGNVITKVTSVADNITNVNLVAPNAQYLSDVANNITAINAIAPLANDLTNVTDNLTAIQNAGTNATNAATSATSAATDATAAQTAKTAAETALDEFTDIYLGSKSIAPTLDNDGNALATGSIYWNSTTDQLYIWDGSAWDDAAFTASGAVTSFNTRSGAVTLSSADITNASGLLTTGGAMTGAITTNSTFDGRDVATDGTKLDTIETNADVTDTDNVVASLTAGTNVSIAANGTISSTDTNTTYSVGDGGLTEKNFTTALKSKLDGIESSATADQTITAGSGLSGGGTGDVTLSHSDTSSQASVNGSGRTYIQDITLDTYGHVTGLATATETVVDTDTTYTAGTDLSLSGTTFNHSDTSTLSGTYGSTSDGTKIDNITVDARGHVTAITTGATGDIQGVTAGTGLSGGGTSGTVTISHPTSAGNKHIPSGGSSGQVLAYSSSGTAVWADAAGGGTETIVVSAGDITNTNLSANGSLSGGSNGRWGFISTTLTGTSNNVSRSASLTTNGSNSHLIVTGWGTNNTNVNRPASVVGSGTSSTGGLNTGEENYTSYRFKIDAGANLVSSTNANISTSIQYIDL
jgi:hypothetical protein